MMGLMLQSVMMQQWSWSTEEEHEEVWKMNHLTELQPQNFTHHTSLHTCDAQHRRAAVDLSSISVC